MKIPSFRSSLTYNLAGNCGMLLAIMDKAGNSAESTTTTSSIPTVRIKNSEAMALTSHH